MILSQMRGPSVTAAHRMTAFRKPTEQKLNPTTRRGQLTKENQA